MRERRESELFDKPRYNNLTWTAPGLASKPPANGFISRPSAPVVSESPSSPLESREEPLKNKVFRPTTNVNGVNGVPTGPKADLRMPDVSDEVKRKPHIFVSERYLPPRQATVKHLFGFLKEFVRGESSVLADEKGYYIVFEDSVEGRDRLRQCYVLKNGERLFNQYLIRMACRPRGLYSSFASENSIQHRKPTDPVAKSTQRAMHEPSLKHTKTDQRQSSLPTPPLGPNSETTDSHLEFKTARGSSMNAESSITGATPSMRHSSPLRVPSRQDKDDTSSSISGFTGSDLSASRSSKCHVCTTNSTSDREILVQCSSCVRRYHRACHPGGIPEGLEEVDLWQCSRCIKKNVQAKSRLSNASFANTASPAPSVGQPEEPPAKKRKFEDASVIATMTKDSTAVNTSRSGEPQSQVADVSSRPTTGAELHPLQNDVEQDYSLPPAPATNSDDLRFREADDLVEKSFTSFEKMATSAEKPKATLKLSFKPKKISRDESTAVISPEERDDGNKTPERSGKETSKQPNRDTGIDREDTSPKRERHKWKGGGADKDIIQAGIQSVFSDSDVRAKGQKPVPGISPEKSVFEVPESAEESRTANSPSKPHVGDTNSSKTQTLPKAPLKLHFTKLGEGRGTGSLKPPVAPVQRMKPGGLSADKCRKCNKTIAFNPLGTKYCSKCKHASSAEAAMLSTASSDKRSVGKDTVPAPEVLPATALAVKNGILDLLKSTDPISDHDPEHFIPTVAEQDTGSQPVKPGTACQECRARKKRCTHRLNQDAPEKLRKGVDEDDPAEDDLDFWAGVNQAASYVVKPETADENSSNERLLHVQNETDRDGSSSLSTPPDDAIPPAAKPRMRSSALDKADSPTAKIRKRMSQARAATSEYDLGDWETRPNNTYKKLIGMALLSAPDHCLQAKEIITWIKENVPGYQKVQKGTSDWTSGISATLSMNRAKENQRGLWKKIGGDEVKKNLPCWYQLLPGQEYEMLHWDPVLNQPVSPMKRSRNEEELMRNMNSDHDVVQGGDPFARNSDERLALPTHVPKRILKLSKNRAPSVAIKHAPKSAGVGKSPVPKHKGAESSNREMNEAHLHEPMASGDVESSDDEPIATKRTMGSGSASRHEGSAVRSTDEDNEASDLRRVDTMNGSSGADMPKKPVTLSSVQQPQLPFAVVDREIVAQLIKKDNEQVEYSAKSLFDEYPELDPANQIDREAKIAEIKRRPTRKQKFLNQKVDPWVHWNPARLSGEVINARPTGRPGRTTHIQTADGSVEEIVHYDSIQDMFGLPKHPIPILLEKEVAYRDGTRNEYDGTLGRAKEKFKTGYAKA